MTFLRLSGTKIGTALNLDNWAFSWTLSSSSFEKNV
jgi:hypothetical protein